LGALQVHHDTEQLQQEYEFLLQAYQAINVTRASGQLFLRLIHQMGGPERYTLLQLAKGFRV